tara:strand:+ start:6316 stop:7050 length:735 start_codon:yes stop_codon:yes gene_type:complete
MQRLFDKSEFEIAESLKIKSLRMLMGDLIQVDGYDEVVKEFLKSDEFSSLEKFLIDEYSKNYCFPRPENIFKALRLVPLSELRVVIIGQDPYHAMGQADGLAFSVPVGVKPPPSLRNIFKERMDDLGLGERSTDLEDLANQGVLLINSVLSVRSGEPRSHRGRGWELLVSLVLKAVNDLPRGVCFILWGKDAEQLGQTINRHKHKVFVSAHPSPLSAYRGFFGSKPFSNVNKALIELGFDEINW